MTATTGSLASRAQTLAPGLLLCTTITFAAYLLQAIEERVSGHPYVEALVAAILIGTFVRSFWAFGARWKPGIAFCAKTLLEIAVVFLGLSISAQAVAAAGWSLVVGIAGVVIVSLFCSYGLCRLLRLPPPMALLIASGNSICGNSAIAAVASVIEADGDDVASSIAFTAILGVIVVLSLPLLIPLLNYSATQYGVLAGLTVYAVPQVLAATAPAGAVSLQMGTLVKLVRVLMLGPVVMVVALTRSGRQARRAANGGAGAGTLQKLSLRRLVPWFILGFLLLTLVRSLGLVPDAVLPPVARLTNVLTVLSMAALGLGVDIRVLRTVGGPVTAAVVLSLVLLLVVSVALIRVLGVA